MSETIHILSRSAAGGLTLILNVVALGVVSAILMYFAFRPRSSEASGRIGLIAPWTHAEAGLTAAEPTDEPMRGHKLGPSERELARRLKVLGIAQNYAPAILHAAQAIFAVLVAAAAWYAAPYAVAAGQSPIVRTVVAALCGVAGWYAPMLAARWAARQRVTRVVAGLPDALELLVICADGGLALGDGIDRIVTGLKRAQPQLAEELELTAADLKVLPDQSKALARLAERIDSPIVQSLVTTLSQTIRFGTPFAQAMRRVASEMRDDALIRIEERANKLPTLLTVPMIFLILPTIFVIIVGPEAIHLMDTFAH